MEQKKLRKHLPLVIKILLLLLSTGSSSIIISLSVNFNNNSTLVTSRISLPITSLPLNITNSSITSTSPITTSTSTTVKSTTTSTTPSTTSTTTTSTTVKPTTTSTTTTVKPSTTSTSTPSTTPSTTSITTPSTTTPSTTTPSTTTSTTPSTTTTTPSTTTTTTPSTTTSTTTTTTPSTTSITTTTPSTTTSSTTTTPSTTSTTTTTTPSTTSITTTTTLPKDIHLYGTGGRIYRSTDSGNTFNLLPLPFPNTNNINDVAINSNNNRILTNSVNMQSFETTNNWDTINVRLAAFPEFVSGSTKITYSSHYNKWYAISTGVVPVQLLESSDGLIWNTLYSNNRFFLIDVEVVDNIIFVTSSEGYAKSTDGINFVTNQTYTLLNNIQYINNKLYIYGDTFTLISEDKGTTWNRTTTRKIEKCDSNGNILVCVTGTRYYYVDFVERFSFNLNSFIVKYVNNYWITSNSNNVNKHSNDFSQVTSSLTLPDVIFIRTISVN